MPTRDISETVARLLEPVCASQGLELVDVEYRPGGRRSLLRVTLDRPGGGITIDRLAEFSREAGDLLDARDAVPGSYTLECSSPGVNRPLRKPADFARYRGKTIRLLTEEPIAGESRFLARLVAASESGIEIEDETHGRLAVPYGAIRRASYEHDFREDLRARRG